MDSSEQTGQTDNPDQEAEQKKERLKRLARYIIILILLLLIPNCYGTGSLDKEFGFGGVQFSLMWNVPASSLFPESISCEESNVSSLTVSIMDAQGKQIAGHATSFTRKRFQAIYLYEKDGAIHRDDSSACKVQFGANWGVPVGSPHRIIIEGLNKAGGLVYKGVQKGLSIPVGQVVDAGVIEMSYVGGDIIPPVNTSPQNFIQSGMKETSKTWVQLSISATDNVGVTAYFLSERSTTPTASSKQGWIPVDSARNYAATIPFKLSHGDGEKQVFVWFKDAAGNLSESASDTITLGLQDTSPPINTTSLDYINNGDMKTSATSVTLSISATDDRGVTAYYLSTNPDTPNMYKKTGWITTTSTKKYAKKIPFTFHAGDGEKIVYVWFRDAAGNLSETIGDTIRIDTKDRIPPVNTTRTNFINKGEKVTSDPTVRFTISATDNVGVTGYFIAKTPGIPLPAQPGWVAIASNKRFSTTISKSLINSDSIKKMVVWFRDAAGNMSGSAIDTITMLIPPVNTTSLDFINKGKQTTVTPTVTLSLSATDNSALAAFHVSESPQQPEINKLQDWIPIPETPKYKDEISFTLSNTTENKTLYVWFKDKAGAISNMVTNSIDLNLGDRLAPLNTTEENFISYGNATTSSTTVILSISAADSRGVNGYYMSESQDEPSVRSKKGWLFVKPELKLVVKAPFVLSEGQGSKSVYVWFRDIDNNISKVASDTILKHLIPKLPDSGQVRQFDDYFGKDSDISVNPLHYKDNKDGTVTDNVTGLIWQQKDDGSRRTWEDSATYCSQLILGGGKTRTKKNSSWRLPTIVELMTIINYGEDSPSINTDYFPDTKAAFYWSSTNYANYSSFAWYAQFDFGAVDYYRYKYNKYYIRCVRTTTIDEY